MCFNSFKLPAFSSDNPLQGYQNYSEEQFFSLLEEKTELLFLFFQSACSDEAWLKSHSSTFEKLTKKVLQFKRGSQCSDEQREKITHISLKALKLSLGGSVAKNLKDLSTDGSLRASSPLLKEEDRVFAEPRKHSGETLCEKQEKQKESVKCLKDSDPITDGDIVHSQDLDLSRQMEVLKPFHLWDRDVVEKRTTDWFIFSFSLPVLVSAYDDFMDGDGVIEKDPIKLLEKHIKKEPRLVQFKSFFNCFFDEVRKKESPLLRVSYLRWFSVNFLRDLFLTSEERVEVFKKTGILLDILKHRIHTNRTAFNDLVYRVPIKELEKLQRQGKMPKWGKLSFLALLGLRGIGFTESQIFDLQKQVGSFKGFKDTNRFNHLIQFLFSLHDINKYGYESFTKDEIKTIYEGLMILLTWNQGPKKMKKGKEPIFQNGISSSSHLANSSQSVACPLIGKRQIEQVSQDLQVLTNILALNGKESFLKSFESQMSPQEFFITHFKSLFNLQEANDLSDRYNKTFGAFRDPQVLFTYLRGINQLPESEMKAVKDGLNIFVGAVLSGQFRSIRFDVSRSLHLQKIFEGRESLKESWIDDGEVEAIENTESEKIDYKVFFYEKIVRDNHLNPQDFPYLVEYLENGELKEGAFCSNDPKEVFQRLAIQVCEGKISPEVYVEEVEKLGLPLEEFENDLNSLVVKEKQGAYTLLETSDPCDLLLMGTEINGSCQRVDGHPKYTKALLSYLMNGEIKPIVVKQGGKIVARSILRLMWDETNQTPVLFQERIYSNVNSSRIKGAIIKRAEEKARVLGISLVSREVGNGPLYQGTVQCLRGFAPYTYSDAGGGIQEGEFEISGSHQIFAPQRGTCTIL